MKTFISITAICAAALLFTISSCKKEDNSSNTPKEQLIVQNWDINRIQLRLYTGSTFIKDTILKNAPKPKNYVIFGSGNSFEYRFNSSTSDLGTYAFKGADSIISTSAPKTYRWKLLTITDELLTVVSTSNNDPQFPGYKVERYETFVHHK